MELDPIALTHQELKELANLHFSFYDLSAAEENSRDLQQTFSSFDERGFCWAIALINAKTLLEHPFGVPNPNDIHYLREQLLVKLFSLSSTPWTQYPQLRQAIIRGILHVPVDNHSGGFTRSVVHPIPAPELNQLLREHFGLDLHLKEITLPWALPEALDTFEERTPILSNQFVIVGDQVYSHDVLITRIGGHALFFEPNSRAPLLIRINNIDPTAPLYRARDALFYHDHSNPLLEVSKV